MPSSIASAWYDLVEKFISLYRIEASQFPDDFQGGSPVSGKGVSCPEEVPGVGILRIDSQGLAVGFDSLVVAVEIGVSAPQAEPVAVIPRIDPYSLTAGFDGVAVAVEGIVSGPEAVPVVGILRIDADGLSIGFDGFIIAL